jgi:hypothetical protein
MKDALTTRFLLISVSGLCLWMGWGYGYLALIEPRIEQWMLRIFKLKVTTQNSDWRWLAFQNTARGKWAEVGINAAYYLFNIAILTLPMFPMGFLIARIADVIAPLPLR